MSAYSEEKEPRCFSDDFVISLSGQFYSQELFDELKAAAIKRLNESVVCGLSLTIPSGE